MLDDGPSVCELCGGALRRVLYPTGIIFKGSGFYRNDSRASSSSAAEASDKSEGSERGGSPEKSDRSQKGSASGTETKTGSTTPEGTSSGSNPAPNDASSS